MKVFASISTSFLIPFSTNWYSSPVLFDSSYEFFQEEAAVARLRLPRRKLGLQEVPASAAHVAFTGVSRVPYRAGLNPDPAPAPD